MPFNINKCHILQVKIKSRGHTLKQRVASVLISVASAHEPEAGRSTLLHDTWPERQPGYHSLPSLLGEQGLHVKKINPTYFHLAGESNSGPSNCNTEALLLSYRVGSKNIKNDYEMHGVKIKSVHFLKDFGVTVTSNLKFSQQSNESVNKQNYGFGYDFFFIQE